MPPSDGPASQPSVPFPVRLGWGVGSLGVAILFNTYSALLLFYLTNVVGLRLEVAGTLIFIAKIYDTLINVPMGVLSDHTKSRWGRRRPWFLLGALLCSSWLVMIFHTPVADPGGASPALVGWVMAALLLYATAYAIFNVPYLAMPAEMTDNYHERTAIMSFRVIFIQVGNFIAVGLGPRIAQAYGGGLEGYAIVGWVLALCTLVTMTACFFGTAGARTIPRSTVQYPFREQLRSALSNRPFLLLAAYKFLTLLSGATVFATLLFFVKNVLKLDQGIMFWYSLAHGVSAFVAVPLLWVPLSKRFGKHPTLAFATIGFMLTALTWLLASPGEPVWLFTARAFLLGAFAAGKLLLGLTLLPDVMEYDRLRTGMRREGAYAGAYNVVEKAAYALSPLMMTLVLGLLGYAESVDNRMVEQTEDAIFGIYLNIAILPATFNAIALVALWRYDLTEERLREMREAADRAGPTPASGAGPSG
jgi:GPH family glycoside/pentoside/hexuronide:cation symporter